MAGGAVREELRFGLCAGSEMWLNKRGDFPGAGRANLRAGDLGAHQRFCVNNNWRSLFAAPPLQTTFAILRLGAVPANHIVREEL